MIVGILWMGLFSEIFAAEKPIAVPADAKLCTVLINFGVLPLSFIRLSSPSSANPADGLYDWKMLPDGRWQATLAKGLEELHAREDIATAPRILAGALDTFGGFDKTASRFLEEELARKEAAQKKILDLVARRNSGKGEA
jgi:hypothetical protein